MPNHDLIHVGCVNLPSIRVIHILCIFPSIQVRPDKKIRAAFGSLREYVVGFDLDPNSLLNIGIPTLDDKGLVSYDCCLEFPLPIEHDNGEIKQKSLPGGYYAILRIDKEPRKIAKAIRQFHADYIPDHQILVDESRPVYEIYYEEMMEYCVPIVD